MESSAFQFGVNLWMLQCFGAEITADTKERNFRFLEESLELVQALGCSKDDALRLVEYVFSRPVGEPSQEVGGVSVTLAALCNAAGISFGEAATAELKRISQPEVVAKIRHKHSTKPVRSPLPGVPPQ